MLHRDLERRFARERQLPRQQLVQNDPDGVDVRALVDRRAACLLRREVLRGPDDRARLGHLARRGARDAEVGHLVAPLRAVRGKQHVVRLHVPVDDPAAVREPERMEDLARRVDRRGDRQRPLRDDPVLERPPLQVLHRDVVGALGLAAVVDRDDVRDGTGPPRSWPPGGIARRTSRRSRAGR